MMRMLALGAVLFSCILAPKVRADQPNLLFILVDDLSWADLGCYGHPWHQTPHIDRLAASGMRFTNGYASAPICSASRASLMTGKSTARLGFEFVTKNEPGLQQIEGRTRLQAPPFTLNLPLEETTIAEHLNAVGYTTAFYGKWHLNQHYRRYLGWSPTHGPKGQGFQVAVEDFGAHPYSWGKKNAPGVITAEGQYAADSMVERVCDFLTQDHQQPFFLMASSFYVHTPVKTPCRWLVDHYDGVIPMDIANRKQRVTYAAFVQTLDHHIGQMLDALERSGKRKETLVVFMSDNGGHPEYTGNGPLRGSKWNLYEGGIRVPLLASWPGRIEADMIQDRPVVGYDLLPTFVELAGGSVGNASIDGVSIADTLLTGQSDPSERDPSERDLLWHFPYYHPEKGYADAKETIGVNDFRVSKTRPQSAMRRGPFKVLWFAEEDRVELYDLRDDIAEQNDLAKDHPRMAAQYKSRLKKLLRDRRARMAVAPPSDSK